MSVQAPQSTNGAPQPWFRHRWPWLLMLGPGVVLVAGFITAWLAYSHQDALVVGDYYKQGKAINQSLKRDRVAAQLGLRMGLGYDAAAGLLQGSLGAREKAPTASFSLRLVHPTQPEKDMNFVVQPGSDGKFSVPLPMFELGHWQVVAEDLTNGWRLAGVWSWPNNRSIELLADSTLLTEEAK